MRTPPKIIVDSNIIVYALNSRSPKHLVARKFLNGNQFRMCFAHQNLMECLRVLTHPKLGVKLSPVNALSDILNVAELGSVISPYSKTHLLAGRLIEKYELNSNLVFDAYLLATAMDNEIGTIAMDNEKHFSRFEEIEVYNPFKE